MPAKSRAQRRAMAIAKHSPEKLHARNRGLLRMSQSQLGDFAKTSERKLPTRKKGIMKHKGRFRPRESRTKKRR